MQRNKPERMMNQSMPNLIKEKSINPKKDKGKKLFKWKACISKFENKG
jgi:hypothetical protein